MGERLGWAWRKASGGVMLATDRPGERRFHAYDPTNHAACKPTCGLDATCEEPNEGSDLCPTCVEVAEKNPSGAARR